MSATVWRENDKATFILSVCHVSRFAGSGQQRILVLPLDTDKFLLMNTDYGFGGQVSDSSFQRNLANIRSKIVKTGSVGVLGEAPQLTEFDTRRKASVRPSHASVGRVLGGVDR